MKFESIIIKNGTNFHNPSNISIFHNKNTSINRNEDPIKVIIAKIKGIKTIENALFGFLILNIIPIATFSLVCKSYQ